MKRNGGVSARAAEVAKASARLSRGAACRRPRRPLARPARRGKMEQSSREDRSYPEGRSHGVAQRPAPSSQRLRTLPIFPDIPILWDFPTLSRGDRGHAFAVRHPPRSQVSRSTPTFSNLIRESSKGARPMSSYRWFGIRTLCGIALFALIPAASRGAAQILVNSSGAPGTYSSLQAAIDAAPPNQVIWVRGKLPGPHQYHQAGHYQGSGARRFPTKGRATTAHASICRAGRRQRRPRGLSIGGTISGFFPQPQPPRSPARDSTS